MPGKRSPVGEFARAMAILGAAAIVVSLFLDWNDGLSGFLPAQTGFEILKRFDVVLVVLAAVAAVFAVVDLFIGWRGLLPFDGLIGFFAFGATIFGPVESTFDHLGAGYFVVLASSLLLGVAGLIAAAESLSVAKPDGTAAQASTDTQAGVASTDTQAGVDTVSPAGWYPDPWGLAGQRYWSGTEWTASTGD